MDQKGRLRKGDLSLIEMLMISRRLYKLNKVDDKSKRAKPHHDIISAKIIARKNYIYDKNSREWRQTDKRHIRFEFLIQTIPVSYKKIDTLHKHTYPVTFVFYDIEGMGIYSPFKWREGGFKKPLFAKKGDSAGRRVQIANQNIKNGTQMQFFFDNETLLAKFKLLYGPDLTNKKLPKKRNPGLMPFFGKHAYFIVTKILLPLLTGKNKQMLLNKVIKA